MSKTSTVTTRRYRLYRNAELCRDECGIFWGRSMLIARCEWRTCDHHATTMRGSTKKRKWAKMNEKE